MEKRTYSIQQVSNITGLSKQLIRKWEDRYGIITPERLDNGYRVYSEKEIELLQQVITLTEAGHSVKQAAMLIQQEHEQQDEQHEMPIDQLAYFLHALEEAGSSANDRHILHLLEQAHHLFGINVLIEQIIVPFLTRAEELCNEQHWDEYQWTVMTQTIRDFLANMRRRLYVPEHAPLVIGSCLPQEQHEIPVQILLIQCMLKGYRTLMLGPSPNFTAIESAVRLAQPAIVLLSAPTIAVWENNEQAIRVIDAFAQTVPHIHFFVNVPAVKGAPPSFKLKAIQEAHSLQDVFLQLKKV